MAIANIRPAAGTTFSVSATLPATYDSSGYSALTFVTVEGVESIPEIGSMRNTSSFSDLGSGSLIKRRGTEDPGDFSFDIADDPSDAGQILLKAAYDATLGSAAERIAVEIADSAKTTYLEVMVIKWKREWAGNDEIVTRKADFIVMSQTVVEA